MKNLILSIAFLFSIMASAQKYDYGIVAGPMTTTEINAISSPQEGRLIYNSTTDTIWTYDGTQWVDTGTGGSSFSTLAELNALVTDATLDDSSDVVHLAGSETITGTKSFDANQTNFNKTVVLNATTPTASVQVEGGQIQFTPDATIGTNTSHGEFGLDSNDYWYFNSTIASNLFGRLNFTGLTGSRTYTLPDVSGTLALTSDITGTYLPLDGSSPMIGDINFDALGRSIGSTAIAPIIYSKAHYYTPTSPATLEWKISANNSNNSLAFEVEPIAGGGSHDLMYSMNDIGTPQIATDLTTKEYVDDELAALAATPLSGSEVVSAIDTELGQTTWKTGGSGDITKVGTPVDNQIGVWTGDGTLEGDSGLTYDGTDLDVSGAITTVNVSPTGNEAVNKTALDSELSGYVAGTISGRTGMIDATNIGFQSQTNYDIDGAPSAGEMIIIVDPTPANSFTGTSIPMDGYYQHDDTATDTATWTIGTSKNGGVTEILINLASEPAPFSTDTGVTQITGTTDFAASTLQLLTIKNIAGTVYYYYTTL